MSQFLFFALILAAVVVLGAVWMLRSAARSATGDEDLDPDEPVAIGGPGTEMDMEIFRSKLEAAGIRAYTRNRTGRVMPGGVPPVLFGWEVLVRFEDVEEAEAILADE